MKCRKDNNDGECRGPFEEYLKEHVIKLDNNVPKTPQHTRVAERINNIIND